MNVDYAKKQIEKIKDCAERAGMGHALFLGFGTLLGLIREKQFIGHDTDTDMGVLADIVTYEQERQFYINLRDADMFMSRHRRRDRPDSQRALWYSTAEHAKHEEGVKTCIWFWWKWKNFHWHSKGRRWVKKVGSKQPELQNTLPNLQAIGKGMPADYLETGLIPKQFYGQEYLIPQSYGSCLTYWYGDFMTPRRGGSSAEKLLLLIDKWEDESTWTIWPVPKKTRRE